ncbi:NfeD family protein [Treponema sp.]|uniref:NfeD family protein n=1 Tax=Treponema sp. TaxID=166 RepID=UPI00388DD36D
MNDFLNFILLHLPWFWLCVMVASLVIEAVTFSLTTVWAAFSALIMIFLSRTPIPLRWQFLIFFLVTIILMIFTRPFAVKKLKLGRVTTNVNSLDGQEVLVLKKITQFEKGEVKSSNGVLWNAMPEENSEIPKGAVCEVVRVEGNTLVVKEKKI